MKSALALALEVLAAVLPPPPRMTLSEWADTYRMLSPEDSAEPGRWRTDRAPFQKGIMDAFSDPAVETVAVMASAQVGKALDINTPILTTRGWSTMGALQVGDSVFDETGAACRVVFATEVMHGHLCYRVIFSDGCDVVADADHLWQVDDDLGANGVIRTTRELAETLHYGKNERNRYAVGVAGPVQFADAELPIDPYLLGVWLGDGSSNTATVTASASDALHFAPYFEQAGHQVEISGGDTVSIHLDRWSDSRNFCVRGHDKRVTGTVGAAGTGCAECARIRARNRVRLAWGKPPDEMPALIRRTTFRALLGELGVIDAKRIPEIYLRASEAQRWALLQGLMDTDGTVSTKGRASFTTTSMPLLEGFLDLVRGLGLKPYTKWKHPFCEYKGQRTYGKKAATVDFMAYSERNIFRMARKQERIPSREGRRTTETERRRVISVEPVESVPVRCIQVDSPSHLYLCGRGLIPTHNTQIINNVVGYYIHLDPSPIMVVQPTIAMAEKWSKTRLAPMLRDTPVLRERVADAKSRDSGNTILEKTFPGGLLVVVGSNAPSGLASQPIRVVLCDEVDRFEASAGTEGDPVDLAFKRSTTFAGRRKHGMISTPGVKGDSRIEKAWNESDQRRYYVPCPHCGEYQVMRWQNVTWPEGEPMAAFYACQACGGAITDAQKFAMLQAGEWRPTAPFRGTAGFHISEIYSPWRTFGEVARDFLKAKARGVESLKVWINTSLGEPWDAREGDTLQVDGLMARREALGAVPAAAGVLVASVDVQSEPQRLEVAVVAYGAGEESWVLEHHVIPGNLATLEPWDRLAELLLATRPRADGGAPMRIKAAAVDIGGHFTRQVYAFAKRPALKGLVHPVKGATAPQQKLVRRSGKKARLWLVDTVSAKDQLHARLQIQQPGPGFVHFDQALDGSFFEQLLAERPVRKGNRRAWEKVATDARNEALDLMVYAAAALEIYAPKDLQALAERAAAKPEPVQEAPQPAPAPQDTVVAQLRRPQPRIATPRRFGGGGGGGGMNGW